MATTKQNKKQSLNLYKILPMEGIYLMGGRQWDVYCGAIVAAYTADEACNMHPSNGAPLDQMTDHDDWVLTPEMVECTLIGKADASITQPQVILRNFRNG